MVTAYAVTEVAKSDDKSRTRAASSDGDNSFGSDNGGGPDHALESKGEKEEKNEEAEGEDVEGEAE